MFKKLPTRREDMSVAKADKTKEVLAKHSAHYMGGMGQMPEALQQLSEVAPDVFDANEPVQVCGSSLTRVN